LEPYKDYNAGSNVVNLKSNLIFGDTK